jgi:hypothetical protein
MNLLAGLVIDPIRPFTIGRSEKPAIDLAEPESTALDEPQPSGATPLTRC